MISGEDFTSWDSPSSFLPSEVVKEERDQIPFKLSLDPCLVSFFGMHPWSYGHGWSNSMLGVDLEEQGLGKPLEVSPSLLGKEGAQLELLTGGVR